MFCAVTGDKKGVFTVDEASKMKKRYKKLKSAAFSTRQNARVYLMKKDSETTVKDPYPCSAPHGHRVKPCDQFTGSSGGTRETPDRASKLKLLGKTDVCYVNSVPTRCGFQLIHSARTSSRRESRGGDSRDGESRRCIQYLIDDVPVEYQDSHELYAIYRALCFVHGDSTIVFSKEDFTELSGLCPELGDMIKSKCAGRKVKICQLSGYSRIDKVKKHLTPKDGTPSSSDEDSLSLPSDSPSPSKSLSPNRSLSPGISSKASPIFSEIPENGVQISLRDSEDIRSDMLISIG